jgi:hypothetical protein
VSGRERTGSKARTGAERRFQCQGDAHAGPQRRRQRVAGRRHQPDAGPGGVNATEEAQQGVRVRSNEALMGELAGLAKSGPS